MHTLPFRSRLVAALAAVLTLATLAGCERLEVLTKTEAPAPRGALDGNCVASCDLKKSQCIQRQEMREQECQSRRGQAQASTGCQVRFGPHCAQPVECLGAVTEICDTQRRECLMDCRVSPTASEDTPSPTKSRTEPMEEEKQAP